MSTGSTHAYGEDLSFIATAALATNNVAVKNDTATNSVVVATANSDNTIGFTQQTQTTAGGPVSVRVAGYTLALAGAGGFTRGEFLTPATGTTAGELIGTTTAGHLVCAIAEDTCAAGEYGEVRIVSPAQLYSTFA